VITDVVNYAVAGIGFIYAMGRLFVRKNFSVGMKTQTGTKRLDQCREQDISVLTEAS
jgi:hypothetical protein